MSPEALIALGVLVVTLLVHTKALFYWAGEVRQMLRDHERRISHLEEKGETDP